MRANMVEHPGQYGWSSYACNASGKDDVLVQPHPLYAALDNKPGQPQCAYRESFCMHLEDDEVHAIRDALNQQLVLGREDFKDKIEKKTNRQTRPRPLACPGVEEDEAVCF